MRPPMLTWCLCPETGALVTSEPPCSFDFFNSDIQDGCVGGGAGLGLGTSGLFKALSSQLDFVGLHLRESGALAGLAGLEVDENSCFNVGVDGLSRCSLELDGDECSECTTAGVLLWLDVGLEGDRKGLSGRLLLVGRPVGLIRLPTSYILFLLLDGAIELLRLRFGGDCILHLLLTLSVRFIMALCTKPPMPLVGESDLSGFSGDMRPCDGDIAMDLAKLPSLSPVADVVSDGGSKR